MVVSSYKQVILISLPFASRQNRRPYFAPIIRHIQRTAIRSYIRRTYMLYHPVEEANPANILLLYCRSLHRALEVGASEEVTASSPQYRTQFRSSPHRRKAQRTSKHRQQRTGQTKTYNNSTTVVVRHEMRSKYRRGRKAGRKERYTILYYFRL